MIFFNILKVMHYFNIKQIVCMLYCNQDLQPKRELRECIFEELYS